MARRLAAIVERVRTKFAAGAGRAARPRPGHPRRSDGCVERLGDAGPLRHDRDHGGAAAARDAHRQHDRLARSWSSPTNTRTSFTSIGRAGLMQGVRRVFGRVPAVFPNAFLPVWQIEGIATFEESRMTGQGRIPAGDFRAIVDVAAAQGRFEPIDRAGGGLDRLAGRPRALRLRRVLPSVPRRPLRTRAAGGAGGRHRRAGAVLWRRRVQERVRPIVDGSVGRLPRCAREGRGRRAATPTRARTRLTHHGFVVTAPRVADRRRHLLRGGERGRLSGADGDCRPAARRARIAWRGYGNRTSVRGDWIVFDQLERVRSVALYSDLYAVRTADRRDRFGRLTQDARAGDPDLSPDGRRIVCTVQATGRRALALLDFPPRASPRRGVLVDDPDADYTGPRWSPDGRHDRRRAAARRRLRAGAGRSGVAERSARSWRAPTRAWSRRPGRPTARRSCSRPTRATSRSTSSRSMSRAARSGRSPTPPAARSFRSCCRTGADVCRLHAGGYDLFSVPLDPASGLTGGTDPELDLPAEARTASSARNPRTRRTARTSRTSTADRLPPLAHARADLLDADCRDRQRRDASSARRPAMFDALGRHGYAVDAGWARRARAARLARLLRLRSLAPDALRQLLRRHRPDSRRRRCAAGSSSPARCSRFRHLRWTETLLAGFDAQTDTRHVRRHQPRLPRRRAPARSALAPRRLAARQPPARSATRSAPKKGSPSRRRPRRAGRRSARTPTPAPRSSTSARYQRVVRAATPCWPAASARAAGWGPSRRAPRVLGRRLGPVVSVVRLRPRHDRPAARLRAGGRHRHARGRREPRSPVPARAAAARRRRLAGLLPVAPRAPRSSTPATPGTRPSAPPTPHLDRRRAVARSRHPPLRAADARRRRRMDARSRRRPQPRRVLRPHRLRLLATDARTTATDHIPDQKTIRVSAYPWLTSCNPWRFSASVAK